MVPCTYDDGNDRYIIKIEDWEEDDVYVALSTGRGLFSRVLDFQFVDETPYKMIISVELDEEESGSDFDHSDSDDSESSDSEDSYSEYDSDSDGDEFEEYIPNDYGLPFQ